MKNTNKETIVSVTCVDKDGYFCSMPYDVWKANRSESGRAGQTRRSRLNGDIRLIPFGGNLTFFENQRPNGVPCSVRIPIIQKNGRMMHLGMPLPAYYERKSKTYFVYKGNEKVIRKAGCLFVRNPTIKAKPGKKGFVDYEAQSIAMQHGYTVNANSNLTLEQRHVILKYIVEKGIMKTPNQSSGERLISFIDWLRRVHTNNIYDKAKERWQMDIDYIRSIMPKKRTKHKLK